METKLVMTTPRPALDWSGALCGEPWLDSLRAGWAGPVLRAWRGTPGLMPQPPLDQSYLVMHLGGPKHVTRRGDGRPIRREAAAGALTFAPAGSAYDWDTSGPIAFAHLYLPDTLLEDAANAANGGLELRDAVAVGSEPVARRYRALLNALASGSSRTLALDAALAELVAELPRVFGLPPRRAPRHTLPTWRLKRVLAFIEANLADDLDLAAMAAVGGSSRFHFARAFREATGRPPYRFVIDRRLERGRDLLVTRRELAVADVAAAVGFGSAQQFTTMFRRRYGEPPRSVRRR